MNNRQVMQTVKISERYKVKTNWTDKAIITTPDGEEFTLLNEQAEEVIQATYDHQIHNFNVIEIVKDAITENQLAVA